MKTIRDALEASLKREPDLGVRKWLLFLDAILGGKTVGQAARHAGASTGHAARWLRAIGTRGIRGVLPEPVLLYLLAGVGLRP